MKAKNNNNSKRKKRERKQKGTEHSYGGVEKRPLKPHLVLMSYFSPTLATGLAYATLPCRKRRQKRDQPFKFIPTCGSYIRRRLRILYNFECNLRRYVTFTMLVCRTAARDQNQNTQPLKTIPIHLACWKDLNNLHSVAPSYTWNFLH